MLFNDRITQWHGQYVDRQYDTTLNHPTCEQAEVLYPNNVSLSHATKIYVSNDENLDKIESIKACFPNFKWEIPCEVKRQLFGKELR